MKSMSLPWRLAAAFLSAALLLPLSAVAGPAVNVALEAAFTPGPYLLELLEAAAEEAPASYYPLLDQVAAGRFRHATTDEALYLQLLEVLQSEALITDRETLSSFQFTLAIRAAAPRIEAHYQYYRTSVIPLLSAETENCVTLVQFGRSFHCAVTLDGLSSETAERISSQERQFDRVLPANPDSPSAILYADINDPSFGQFHKVLSENAKLGRSSYRLRYKPSSLPSSQHLPVQGYGVELSLKRTDYIVIDDRQAEKDKELEQEEAKHGADAPETKKTSDLKPLSKTELSKLGPKASSFVLDSTDPFQTLLMLSQDFPKHSSSIAQHNISEAFITELHANRETSMPTGYNVVWINGAQVDSRQFDAFALSQVLRRERRLINGLRKLGMSGPDAVRILSHPAIAESNAADQLQRYDYRDELDGGGVIVWLNDIEKDSRYKSWPLGVQSLLQRTYPGQLPTARCDVHRLVVPVDFSSPEDVNLVVEDIQTFVKRKVPLRFGLVPLLKSPASVKQAKIVYHLFDTYGLAAVLAYLSSSLAGKKVSSPSIPDFDMAIKDRNTKRDKTTQSLQILLEAEDSETRLGGARRYLKRLAIDSDAPPIFINGIALPRDEGWMQAMSQRVAVDLQTVQKGVYEQEITDETDIPARFLASAASRRNPLVIPTDESAILFVDVGKLSEEHAEIWSSLPTLPAGKDSAPQDLTHILLLADLSTEEGLQLLRDATDLHEAHGAIELAVIHNPSSTSTSLQSLSLVGESGPLVTIVKSFELLEAQGFWFKARSLVNDCGLKAGQNGLVVNGRVLGPIPDTAEFSMEDFKTLLEFEKARHSGPALVALLMSGQLKLAKDAQAVARITSLVALSSKSDIPDGIFERPSGVRVTGFGDWGSSHSSISTGDADTAIFQITASIDPTSEAAQRWVPILKVLSELDGVYLQLFLNPRNKLEELPIKRFYRHVLEAKPSFDSSGALRSPTARFEGLPEDALLTAGMDVPPSWLVSPKESIYDLDNIKLNSLKDGSDIQAIYELEHILIEGHSRDVTNGQPPRGAQLWLGTQKEPHTADTIIMSNLGYFQFKANPGFWKIELQPGRSQEIFHIDSAGTKGYSAHTGDETTEIELLSFQGTTLFPRLSRKAGQENEDVLEPATSNFPGGIAIDFVSKGLGFASDLLSRVTGLTPSSSQHADINIFSVASGHLYERMLNIMMVSVMSHTTHTVKFWFIEQFLSPSFKAFLPVLAAQYKFDYEMVTYKWPHWLRAQREKQREIWGYKILFLDVLFPLSLEKVIFVDADQIVRTDMHDLVNLDLHGAPYAFTPMCDSRAEMEGFRFWKQGYWKSFLRGSPYHISALYVVDLRRFRASAAGDRLRQHYQQLSADPASLANLDQDLPNHMQHMLPIHSLPQEWLWCETWCADEGLKTARTIDLCNNPLTKEPKLERARRQVPEWNVYDEEIEGVRRRWLEGGERNTKSRAYEEGASSSSAVKVGHEDL